MNRRKALLAASMVGAVALAGGVLLVQSSRETADAGGGGVALTTTKVQKQDLTLVDETTATLEFVASATISAPVAGTITEVLAEGDTVQAGTVVATLDGEPVVALYGSVPTWRDLSSESDDGVDVHQLELNLVALGFDPDGAIEIDETYDDATAAAVELWETSLGLDEDGEVPQARVIYVPGVLLVDTVDATVGGGVQSGSSLLTGRITERRELVASTSEAAGAVDRFAAAGTPVVTGTVLFYDAGYPVVAVIGDTATLPLLERDLSTEASDGADVEVLERLLRDGGFDPDGAMTIDDEFDAATVAAVLRWYESLGMPYLDMSATDVTVPAGSFVVVADGLEVGTPLLDSGTDPGREAPALTLTSPARVVSTTAPLGDESFALGASVEVEFPDGTTTTGTVTKIGTTATNASGTPGETPSVPITIEVPEIPDSANGFVQIPVTLRIVTQSVPDALVVPVSALVALAEGGYAVEIADTSSGSRLVAVETGLFVDGFVQVTGDGLSEGLDAVVPS